MKNERTLGPLHPVTSALKDLISQMVSTPQRLRVVEEFDSDGKLDIYAIPAQTDYRIVCGTRGRMIDALKYIAEQAGRRQGIECELHLEESYRGEIQPNSEFVQQPEVNIQRLVAMTAEMANLLLPNQVDPKNLVPERDNDELTLRLPIDLEDPRQVACLSAIADVAYALAYKNGIILKVKKPKPVAA